MTGEWKRFLLLHVPTAAIVLFLIAQAAAWALSGVPLRRDRADELVLAASEDPKNYRVVLLGDSVTRNATSRFSLGRDVANMATNAHFGIAGEALLLQRYLEAHLPPKYVVLVLSPSLYGYVADLRIVRYNLWRTFRRPEERSFLKTYLPNIDRQDWMPAAASLQEQIVEPLFSWLKSRYLASRGREVAHVASGPLEPDPGASAASATVVTHALDRAIAEGLPVTPAPINEAALRQVCLQSEQHGFRVKLATPPIVPEIENAVTASGAAAELERNIRRIMAGCHLDEIVKFNRMRAYTAASFRLDMTHLFGEGWEQRYASDLRTYLKNLPD